MACLGGGEVRVVFVFDPQRRAVRSRIEKKAAGTPGTTQKSQSHDWNTSHVTGIFRPCC